MEENSTQQNGAFQGLIINPKTRSRVIYGTLAYLSLCPRLVPSSSALLSGLSLEIVNSAAAVGRGLDLHGDLFFKRLRQTTIVSSCNTSLLQLGGNCVLVTACVSADTVSAKAYASHSRLGTGCSCSLYDIYYTMNTTLSTG